MGFWGFGVLGFWGFDREYLKQRWIQKGLFLYESQSYTSKVRGSVILSRAGYVLYSFNQYSVKIVSDIFSMFLLKTYVEFE